VKSFNVGSYLDEAAARNPDGKALISTEGGQDNLLLFGELLALCDRYASGLRTFGLRPGDRVLVMERNGPRFVALTFALFKLGAMPVLLDPGMGVKRLLDCITELKPDCLIGIRKSHFLRSLHPKAFASVRRAVCTDGRWLGARPLWKVTDAPGARFSPANTSPDQTAAILYTSGSTGPAKGVLYRHGTFRAQVDALQEMFQFQPGEVDMPGFPLFALISTALGMTCVLPEMNPSRPAEVDPARLVRAIQDWQVNNLQGSPAIWERVGRFCQQHDIKLPSLKRVITFGAPISTELVRTWKAILPDGGEFYTPYGATEALPVCHISGREILEDSAAHTREGGGTCVGKPVPGLELKIVRVSDEAITTWNEDQLLATGQIGEIVVAGEQVTWAYDRRPEETKASKIIVGDKIWHRMGDLGYLDAQGKVWMVGRKSERIQARSQVFYPVCAEGMVNDHPDVARSALVGVGPEQNQRPVLVVEPRQRRFLKDPAEQNRLARELRERLHENSLFADIKHILFRDDFPVDPRHNAKIDRLQLGKWAATRVPAEGA
jgi:acyl-CoA synthetase (AMP-forming)/AMP-acid ligase II